MAVSFSDKELFWAIVLMVVVTLFMGFIMWFVLQAQGATEGVFEGLEDKMYENRMVYSPNCLAYKNVATGRTYSGTIDLKKFTDSTMFDCIPIEGLNERAILIELGFSNSDGNYVFRRIKTRNWDDKAGQLKLVSHTLPVNVYGEGPGSITFIHRY